METEVFAADVGSFCHMADCFQVHTVMGMDNGVSGSEAEDFCAADMGTAVCRI